MSYTGHVEPGGAVGVRELAALSISKLSVGPMDNNAYLLRCHATGDQLLIDAANEPQRLLELVGEPGLATVVTTHRHPDHWVGLSEVVKATGARSLAHRDDAKEIPGAAGSLDDGDTVRVGQCSLEVIHLRGHTPGSIALLYRDDSAGGRPQLFTGDSLFPGGPGRVTHPDDFTSLMDDLERKVFGQLDDQTWVYPGHGDDTTLGAERPKLGEWRARGW
ncbi:MBL fold metallo-hydrolase [Pilimelia columellifera]|uniref:MBL fold metallo-hydrolase n=1 Tax=Pilimelia columellifera subsp. columellifera TaxID=706583 RepID=A0ABN3NBD1_9ACTN